MSLSFDEFQDKLESIQIAYEKLHGRKMSSIHELEEYLMKRKIKRSKSSGLKSLKGILR